MTGVVGHVMDEGDHAARWQLQPFDAQWLTRDGVILVPHPTCLELLIVFGAPGVPQIGCAIQVCSRYH